MQNIGISLGQEIKKYRQRLGISQEELSFRAGINTAHLGQIERAEKNPTIETVSRIAEALGITLSQLFSFSVNNKLSNDNFSTIDTIISYLNTMTDEEQKDILKIIKVIRKFKNRK